MSDVIIKIENLSKEYRYGVVSHNYLFKDLQSWWAKFRGKEDPNARIGRENGTTGRRDDTSTSSVHRGTTGGRDDKTTGRHETKPELTNERPTDIPKPDQPIDRFWALRDVNLEIKQGDLVGIIGRNGAGKSTLLKILSRVTAPTTGSIKVKGRIGSLLEVGTGFHPELTGRENVFLNGAILGMRKKEILNKFDEIVDFAEIEKFIDTPVKRYSSGMYVRLAFAVAAHLDPEILVVDEVLAVGDAQFQKKCLGKMGDVSNNEGRTVLFVSHNMTAIRSLCRNAVQLDHGMVEITGDVQRVVSSYLSTTKAVHERIWDTPEIAPGNESVRFHYARVAIDMPNPPDQIRVNTPLKLEFAFWNYLDNAKLNFSMHVLNAEGMMVFNSGGGGERCPKGLVQGICYIPGNFLNDEKYSIMMMIVIDGSHGIFTIHDLLQFDVLDVERDGAWMGKWPGVVRPALKWDVKALGCF